MIKNRAGLSPSYQLRRTIMTGRILLTLVAAAAITLGGCSKKSEPAPPSEPAVTEENLDSELDKMEKEIEADIAAEE
jgi:PBP1b-binding outer membrane lipoprotein LpoB